MRRHPRRVQILELGHLLFFFIVLCGDLLVVPCGHEPSACTAYEQGEHEEQTVDDRHILAVPLLLVVFGGLGSFFWYHASVSRQLASQLLGAGSGPRRLTLPAADLALHPRLHA
ncbi:MAG: hypothetical protein ACXWQ5_23700 [Ktedonobacterales bacterium]